ncbi:MAG: 4Fe-4S binding protein [Denitrobacterium sp.]|jgi:ech hydrogenase subunit F|nr:4Fe-4S binding protein [Denitrobacterium sp.]MCI1479590.1 4Fe-4S binding protein [Eggerthellaceae bacterium]
MGSFKLGKMTLKSLFTKPSTVLYPFEEKPQPAGIKGHIENDITACTLCGTCSRVCPAGALIVDRKAGTWSIDHFRCVQCKSCVLNCPVPCLTMAPGYQKPAREISRETLQKPAPSPEELAAKEAAKKAKIEAAMKAKAAREAAK